MRVANRHVKLRPVGGPKRAPLLLSWRPAIDGRLRVNRSPAEIGSDVAVWAVVVTHNRLSLLRQCLAALAVQTRRLDEVLVIDNASIDGTAPAVAAGFPWVRLQVLPTNEGGAGGFHEGLRSAHAAGAEWVWLMDDDTIAQPEALARLLAAPSRLPDEDRPVLLASRAVWDDGHLHPMNAPGFERDDVACVVAGCERGLMPLRTATFVSLLVHRGAVDRHGLPLKHYFIWSDDIEYTARILRHERGYLVPTSIVHHRTPTAYTAVSTSGDRFYFHIRNTLFMVRGSAWSTREKLTLVWIIISTSHAYLAHNRWSSAHWRVVARGLRDGLRAGAARSG